MVVVVVVIQANWLVGSHNANLTDGLVVVNSLLLHSTQTM